MKKQNLKNYFLIAIGFIAITFVFNSCSQKDEELTKPSNSSKKITVPKGEYIVQLIDRNNKSRQYGPTQNGYLELPSIGNFNDNLQRIRVLGEAQCWCNKTIRFEIYEHDQFKGISSSKHKTKYSSFYDYIDQSQDIEVWITKNYPLTGSTFFWNQNTSSIKIKVYNK